MPPPVGETHIMRLYGYAMPLFRERAGDVETCDPRVSHNVRRHTRQRTWRRRASGTSLQAMRAVWQNDVRGYRDAMSFHWHSSHRGERRATRASPQQQAAHAAMDVEETRQWHVSTGHAGGLAKQCEGDVETCDPRVSPTSGGTRGNGRGGDAPVARLYKPGGRLHETM